MDSDNDDSMSDIAFVPPKDETRKVHHAFQFDLATFLIGPLSCSLWLFLHHLGFPPLFIIFVITVFGFLFAYRAEMSIELIVRLLTRLIVHIFFREINSRNAYKIPQEGPVIFICAPHANQFLDPAVMMEFVPRPVSFLIAASSYRKRLVGAFARGQRSIPVERPQDLAVAGPGTVSVNDTTVSGIGTRFTEFLSTDSIMIHAEIIKIAEVVSDTQIKLASTHTKGNFSNAKYKRVPKIDQHLVFRHVWDTLVAGNCVGIFPEGGSHDRSDLLPLKAGVAIMALGAAAKYPGLKVKLVTVGLNYFHGHRFRGRCYVEYGDPFSLPPALVEQYAQGGGAKIEACNTLLDMIRDQLRTVTVSAPSWDQLQLLWAVRRLYQPSGVKLPPKLSVVLIRRFAEGYDKVKDRADVQHVVEKVRDYNSTLRLYGLRDHQVSVTRLSRASALAKLSSRLIRLVLITLLAVPGTLLNVPILLVTRLISRRKAAEAMKGSTVKVKARDVLASWKVLTSLSLVPLVLVIYPSLAALVGWLAGWNPLYTWGNFAVLQPVMMWAAVRSTETWWDIARSIRPLFLAVTDRKASKIADIRRVRTGLKTEIRGLVDLLGPQLYGPQFSSLRMFAPELRKHRHGRPFSAADEARFLEASEQLSVDSGAAASETQTSLDLDDGASSRGGPSQGSDYVGSVDEVDEHRYLEERELSVPPEVLRVLSGGDGVAVGEEYRAVLDSTAMAPLEADMEEEAARVVERCSSSTPMDMTAFTSYNSGSDARKDEAEIEAETEAKAVLPAKDVLPAKAEDAAVAAAEAEPSISCDEDEGVVVERPEPDAHDVQTNHE